MPNRRMIHASIWQDEDIAGLTDRQQLLFIGLFSNADDQGRLKGHPMLIKSLVFPYRDVSSEDMLKDLEAITKAAAVLFYEVEDKSYIQLTKWWEYQQLQWAKPSALPAPEDWIDRIRVRSGDGVRVEGWPGVDDNPDATPKETPVTTGRAITELNNNITELNDNDNITTAPAPIQSKRAKSARAGAVSCNALQTLLDMGMDPETAQALANEHPEANVLGWCAESRKRKLENPPGWVRSMLVRGHSPPAAYDNGLADSADA